jgi:hypothetical protein
MYSFLRIMNVSCFYFPSFILKFNSGLIKYILEIYIYSKNYAFLALTIKQQSRVRILRMLASQVSSISWQHKLTAKVSSIS